MTQRISTLLLSLILSVMPLSASTLTGTVISVKDGDTIVIRTPKNIKHTIRLAHIDTPEWRQAYSKSARNLTLNLTHNKTVKVEMIAQDKYNRIVGVVYVGTTNVNKELVINGLAWWYKKYSNDPRYETLQNTAKQNKIGLWKDPHPIPPWNYRWWYKR